MVTRERGSDPASVCYATIERAEEIDADLVLIDTAGRLHTSKDLMAELEKVCKVTRKRSNIPVYIILVIDATTGQNGLIQAKEFNEFLDLDGLIVTKLDGTAKGGIALAISKELDLPILKIGVGEKIEDLRNFNAKDFAKAFIGNINEEKPEVIIDSNDNTTEDSESYPEADISSNENFNPKTEPIIDKIEEPKQETEPAAIKEDDPYEEATEEAHSDSESAIENSFDAHKEESTKEDSDQREGKVKGLFRKLFVD